MLAGIVLIDNFALAPAAMDLLIINLKPLSKGYLFPSGRNIYIFLPEEVIINLARRISTLS